MKWMESKFYTNVMIFTDYILLSVLWTVCCLPVITLFSSTTGMFAVVKGWRSGNSNGILKDFISEFKHHFFQKLLLNIMLIVFFMVIMKDFSMILSSHSFVSTILLSMITIAAVLVCGICVHLFNVYVSTGEKKVFVLLKNTLIITVAQIPWTILGLLYVGVCIVLVYLLPFMIFIIGSFSANLLIRISDRAMKELGLSFNRI